MMIAMDWKLVMLAERSTFCYFDDSTEDNGCCCLMMRDDDPIHRNLLITANEAVCNCFPCRCYCLALNDQVATGPQHLHYLTTDYYY